MKKIKRVWVVSLVLSAIVLLEGIIVVYDLLRANPENYTLAETETNISARVVEIKPFVFENGQTAKMLVDLNYAESLMKENSLLNQIIVQSAVSSDNADTQNAQKTKDLEKPAVQNVEKKTEQSVKNKQPQKLSKAIIGGQVMIAVVIDDMGVSVPHTRDILSLEKPITASFLTYGAANSKQVKEAKEKGFEVMLHVPMMPHVKADLAPVTLSPNMSEDEIKNDFVQMLDRYKGLGMKGVNNHMGSLFTEDEKSLGYVMQVLKERNLFFLDSKTTAKSVGEKVAAEYGVPYIARDVFLDNENDYNYIMKQFHQTEKIAHMRGYAVAIGHPRTQTYLALRDWIKDLPERKIRLVRLGDLVKEVNKKAEN